MFNYDRKSDRRLAIKPSPVKVKPECCFFCLQSINLVNCGKCTKVICNQCVSNNLCIGCSCNEIRMVDRVLTKNLYKKNFFYCCY